MELVHVTISAERRGSLFPSASLRRRALHALARVAGRRIVLFCIVDDHVHIVVLVDARGGPTMARNLLFALRPLSVTDLAPPHVKPVNGRSHMEWLLRYLVTQPLHHGLSCGAAWWEGSCLWDLLGARVLPGARMRDALTEALPRVRDEDIAAMVGIALDQLRPADLDVVRDVGASALVAACRRATAPADPQGRTRAAVQARAAALRIGQAAGFPTVELARACGVDRRIARAQGRVEVPDDVCWSALRQITLFQRWLGDAESPIAQVAVP